MMIRAGNVTLTFSLHVDIRPSKQLHWICYVLAGFFMCKIVYDLTAIISASLFKKYKSLSDRYKVEWNNRGFSTFHAIVVAAASLYLLTISNLFVDTHTELMINRASSLSDFIMGFSIGYFLSDLALIIYHYPTLGGMEYFIHHGLSVFSITVSLLTGQAHIYTLMVLFTEITTPFVNLRWYLDVAGFKNSEIYIYNGVAMFIGWLVARIILLVYFFQHMFFHFNQVKTLLWPCYYTLITVPPVLSVMNLIWFWKIVQGMVKTLRKATHSR